MNSNTLAHSTSVYHYTTSDTSDAALLCLAYRRVVYKGFLHAKSMLNAVSDGAMLIFYHRNGAKILQQGYTCCFIHILLTKTCITIMQETKKIYHEG